MTNEITNSMAALSIDQEQDQQQQQHQEEQQLLTYDHFCDLAFSDLRTKFWLIDDSQIYRVVIERTPEGNFSASPLNGVLLVLNPNTGVLQCRVLSKSVWRQPHRVRQLSHTAAADCLQALLQTAYETPEVIVALRQNKLVELLRQRGIDGDSVRLFNWPLQISLAPLLKLPQISNRIDEMNAGDHDDRGSSANQSSPHFIVCNVYDDMMQTFSSYTCFSRLVLLLRAMRANATRTRQILHSTFADVATSVHHLWPSFNVDQWLAVEALLLDLLLEEYCTQNSLELDDSIRNMLRTVVLMPWPSDEKNSM